MKLKEKRTANAATLSRKKRRNATAAKATLSLKKRKAKEYRDNSKR